MRVIFSFQIVYDANTRNPRAIVCSLSSHQILDVCHLVFLLLAVYPLISAIWHIKCEDTCMSMHFEIACTANWIGTMQMLAMTMQSLKYVTFTAACCLAAYPHANIRYCFWFD